MNQLEYKERTSFVIELGMSLHRCGATSQRVERHLRNLAKILGIHGNFLLSPTTFTAVFWLDDKNDQFTHIERIEPNGENLGRLWSIDELVDKIVSNEVTFRECAVELAAINDAPPHYKPYVHAIAWMTLGSSFAALLSSNINDIIVSGLLSLAIFGLNLFSTKSARLGSLIEILAPMVAGLAASIITLFGIHLNVPFVILSSIIAFIPGLALTTALSEISSKNLIAGTSRFVDAIMLLFKLYFGAALGITIPSLFISNIDLTEAVSPPASPWIVWGAIIFLAIALTVSFNIKPKRALWGLASSFIAFYVASKGADLAGISAGVFLGAMTVGLYSNVVARYKNIPSSIPLNQGIILLVPGSKTCLLLNTWVAGTSIVPGADSGNQAVMIFISLIAGILFANAIFPNSKSL